MKKYIFIIAAAVFFLAAQNSFAAISYERAPSGSGITNPVNIKLTADSWNDFGFTEGFNYAGLAFFMLHSQKTFCFASSSLSLPVLINQSFTLPVGEYYEVDINADRDLFNCEQGNAHTGFYELEEQGGANIIFSVVAAPPSPSPSPISTASPTVTYNNSRIVPLIGILKIPTPLALPLGSGPVTYGYTAWNVGGQQALIDVTVTDDKCSPVVFLSGDINDNGKLDPGEYWQYSCSARPSETTTNSATATGYSDDGFRQAAIDTAIATVVVGAPTTPPLIAIVKVPSRLTPFPFGGGDVTYFYAVTNPGVVAIHDVVAVDDKCSPLFHRSGDENTNNLLDPSETWIYTCQTNVSVSTSNKVTVEGRANGFIARDEAFATVFVSETVSVPAPGFPDTGPSSVSASGELVRTIVVNLSEGSRGNDVKILQDFLIFRNIGPSAQALARVGATAYFGVLTRAALAEFQASTGINPPLGNFGPITRGYLSTH